MGNSAGATSGVNASSVNMLSMVVCAKRRSRMIDVASKSRKMEWPGKMWRPRPLALRGAGGDARPEAGLEYDLCPHFFWPNTWLSEQPCRQLPPLHRGRPLLPRRRTVTAGAG